MSGFETPTATRARLIEEMGEVGFERTDLEGTSIAVFRRGSYDTPVAERFRSIELGEGRLSVNEVRLEEGVSLHLLQLREPQTSNGSSIVAREEHNGVSVLYLGDAGVTVIDEITRLAEWGRGVTLVGDRAPVRQWGEQSEAIATLLRVDILKWPHHAWMPRTPKQQEIVRRFLQTVRPKEILLSVGPTEVPGQHTEQVTAFVKKCLPGVRVRTTRDDGHIRIRSELMLKLGNLAAVQRPAEALSGQ